MTSSSSDHRLPHINEHVCAVCRRILSELPEIANSSPVREYYKDFHEVFYSEKFNCYLCSSLKLERQNCEDATTSPEYIEVQCWKTDGGFLLALYTALMDTKYERKLRANFNVVDLENIDKLLTDKNRAPEGFEPTERDWYWQCPKYDSSVVNTRTPTVAAPAVTTVDLGIAKKWLKNCVESHKDCNSEIEDPHWYPSRLLRLDRSSEGISVHLVETEGDPVSGRYISLSHRWAGQDFTTLTIGKLDSMKHGIDFKSLSKTYQDAINVTLDFGCNYLWIDSLCIIQDLEEDWLKESALMRKVYQNAFFTISATQSPSLNTGLTSVRHFSHVATVFGDIRFDPESQQTRKGQIFHLDLWRGLVIEAPINRRGWVLQERLLSRRILHFASSQLAWECDEQQACELYPDNTPYPEYVARLPGHATRKTLKHALKDAKTWHPSWRRIVEDYSLCGLTNRSDKLIAISGIAEYVQRMTNEVYLAGLWKIHFIASMEWKKSKFAGYMPIDRPHDYCAPSWSWAALDRPVDYGSILSHPDLEVAAELLDWNITLVDPNNPTGPVSSGSATVKGQIVNIHCGLWERNEDNSSSMWAEPANGLEYANLVSLRFDPTFDDDTDTREDFVCLILRRSKNGAKEWQANGTLLYAVDELSMPSGTSGTFRRAGHFRAESKDAYLLLARSREATISLV